MVLDILILAILILAMVFGSRIGFVWSFFHTLSWIASIILAFIFTPWLRGLLISETGLYEALNRALSGRFASAAGIDSISSGLPRILKDTVDSLARQTVDAASASICDLLFTIISFLIIVFVVKFIFFAIIFALSKKHAGGARGVIDGILGMIFGFVKGILLVFVLLAAMIPIISLFDTGLVDVIHGWLDSSYFAGSLYDNNFLALILRDFLIYA